MSDIETATAPAAVQTERPAPNSRIFLLSFATAMFVGAGLLFWIQPMFAKMVLPLLGGSPAVWNTAMVFFQAMLLAGYAYAHILSRTFRPLTQLLIHLSFLAIGAVFLPISVAQGWVPDAESIPVLWLFGLLGVSIGLPFMAVSATAPLMQRWFSISGHAHAADPYFLYGASNLGSILGLLGFPLILAPFMTVREQSLGWSAGYAGLALLIVCAGWMVARRKGVPAQSKSASKPATQRPDWRSRLAWIAYSAVPSALLLGVTGHISTDIAAAPLMWIVPLTLYLLTFVIVFARRPILHHRLVLRAFPFGAVLLISFFMWRSPTWMVLPLHLLAFFGAALVCHGELARRRPEVSSLTEFYLLISLGGLLGGTLTAVVAPWLFDGVYEYPIAIAAACALLPAAKSSRLSRGDVLVAVTLLAVILGFNAMATSIAPAQAVKWTALLTIVLGLVVFGRKGRPAGFGLAAAAVIGGSVMIWVPTGVLSHDRSFFGVYRVVEYPEASIRVLVHGTTQHGGQRVLGDGTVSPISYHAPGSPIAEIIGAVQEATVAPSIGVIGLGAGALACYRRPDEDWRFYEIDPLVVRLAMDQRLFDLMGDCAPDAPIIIGDARLTLEREASGYFDLLVVDAFTSDAIPMHLMTREAFELYVSRVRDNGVVVLNISNRYLDLRPIVAALVADLGLVARTGWQPNGAPEDEIPGGSLAISPSLYVAVSRTADDLDRLGLGQRWLSLDPTPDKRAWSDDYSNILEAFSWNPLHFD